MTNSFRVWNLATLFLGIAVLIVGGRYVQAPDWDAGVSVVMALATYITAPWCMRQVFDLKWRSWWLVALGAWFAVDGCYTTYWAFVDPDALVMRDIQWKTSICLWAICGLIWMPPSPRAED